MNPFEATLWAFASVVLLVVLLRAVAVASGDLGRDSAMFSLCQAVAYLAVLVGIQTVYFPRARLGPVLGTRPGRWVFFPIALLLGVAIHPPADAIYEAALARWPTTTPAESIVRQLAQMPPWRKVAAGIGLVALTPLLEEMLFRGALFGALRRRHDAVTTVVVTSLLFAFVHIEPQLMLPIAMVGAALAFLRFASGSVWPGVVLHMTFNGVTFFAVLHAAGSGSSAVDEPFPTWVVIAGAVVTAGLVALTDFLRVRSKKAEPAAEEGAS